MRGQKSSSRSRFGFVGLYLTLSMVFQAPPRLFATASADSSSCEGLCFTNASLSANFFSLDIFGGHGIQVTDVNGDGWLDVYVTHIAAPGQDRPDLLFVNQGTNAPRFEEVGTEAGVSDDGFYQDQSEESHAAVFADLDNDGDFDLFNAHTWNGHNRLYRK